MPHHDNTSVRLRAVGWLGAVGAVLAACATASQASVPPDFSALPSRVLAAESAPQSFDAAQMMVAVPAGDYPIGRDDGGPSEAPAHTVSLQGFLIDRTEVTNAAFAEYLNALDLEVEGTFAAGEARPRHMRGAADALLLEGARASDRYPIIALDDDEARIVFQDGRFTAAPGFEDHPVAETTWAGARSYCEWRGARLPTEVEWEAAARGEEGRLYPWGDAGPDAARVFASGRSGVTGPVGARPAGASPFGALDMSGSMAEWTASLKRPYPYDAADGREDPALAGERVTRGGDYVFDDRPDTLTATHRDGFSNAPERGHRHIGFRCARSALDA